MPGPHGRQYYKVIRSEIVQQDTFVKERTALAVQPEQGEDTIDLLELFMGLLAHWTLIAATAVVGAVLMALYTFFLVTPMYKATTTIYVVSRNDSVLNFSDLQVGSELTSDYIKVFEMWEVHEKVISNLGLDYTYTTICLISVHLVTGQPSISIMQAVFQELWKRLRICCIWM